MAGRRKKKKATGEKSWHQDVHGGDLKKMKGGDAEKETSTSSRENLGSAIANTKEKTRQSKPRTKTGGGKVSSKSNK